MQSQNRKVLLPYAIVVLFSYIAFALPLPIFPGMFLDPERSILPGVPLQTRMILLGLMMASFPLGQFFGSPVLGRLSDHWGRKRVILYSLSGTTLGYFVTSWSVHALSVWGMFLGLVLCGFCEGNTTIAQSVIADLTSGEGHQTEKAVHFGWINAVISIGFIVGPLMGGVLADPQIVSWFTFATPFWAGGCMTVIGILVIWRYSRETLQVKRGGEWKFFNSLWSGMQRPQLKRFYAANLFLALGYFAFYRFFPVFLQRRFAFSASELSYVMVYDALAWVASVIWLIPFLSRRFKPVQSLCLFSFLLAATYLICLLPSSPYGVLYTIPPVGVCLAVVITNGALLISNASSQEFQGQAMGTLTSVQMVAEFATGITGGALAADRVELPLCIGAAMTVICGILLSNRTRKEIDV